MGSQRWVYVHEHDSGPEAVAAARAQGQQVLAAHFSDTAVPYREVDFTRPTAVLFGTEKFGITERTVAAVDQHVIIPMMGMVESFNVSVAAAIILAEACEQRRAKGFYDQPRIDPARYHELLFRWGHERIARLCDAEGIAYPELDDEGQVKDSAALSALLKKKDQDCH
jgi:tRNA (guanosine-2'-O-)-methyltransferase